MMLPTDHLTKEHYWIVGFLEGEGSFGTTGGLVLQVVASQKQREPLDRLQGYVGGNIGAIYCKERRYWRWTLCGNAKAEPFLILIRPLMSPRRQWQIDKALAKRVIRDRRNMGGNRNKTSCPQGHPYNIFTIEKDGTPHRKCSICQKKYNQDNIARQKAKRNENKPEVKRYRIERIV